jgi:hypothetical protein
MVGISTAPNAKNLANAMNKSICWQSVFLFGTFSLTQQRKSTFNIKKYKTELFNTP